MKERLSSAAPQLVNTANIGRPFAARKGNLPGRTSRDGHKAKRRIVSTLQCVNITANAEPKPG